MMPWLELVHPCRMYVWVEHLYIRSHSVVIGANVLPCHVMGSENVSFITKGFLSWEREWNLASALFLGRYMCVLLRLGFWTFPLSSSFVGKPPRHGNQKRVILLWRVFCIGTWQKQLRYMSGVCRHWWENSLVMGSGNVSFYYQGFFSYGIWGERSRCFWEQIRCIHLGIVYNLYMLCVYIFVYIWSRPCKSLHAIESKNLSMLLRVLSPWEREGSDAAAVFFFNLDVANRHMSKFF
jgi:hypothetical protein